MSVTAVLSVPSIEPELPFWAALGFSPSVTVPRGDVLGFAILTDGCAEVMLQSGDSLADDVPEVAPGLGQTLLYVHVPDLDAAATAVSGAPVAVERRTTFYGAHELGVRTPSGHVVLLSQHG
ncbi:MAG: hypothetical protein KC621_29700 [Myxococcales bacterium]|nr:hypothetical protein [Myxococcales bacterium]